LAKEIARLKDLKLEGRMFLQNCPTQLTKFDSSESVIFELELLKLNNQRWIESFFFVVSLFHHLLVGFTTVVPTNVEGSKSAQVLKPTTSSNVHYLYMVFFP